jgi:dipeptidyl aminopeptidase/acylaminoacyl peptidase
MKQVSFFGLFILFALGNNAHSQKALELEDIFQLEYISDPQISPDGSRILYVRNSMDIYSDRAVGHIWMIQSDGTQNRPVTSGQARFSSPRWAPDSKSFIYTSNQDRGVQVYRKWLDSSVDQKLSNFEESPSNCSWSPDGQFIVFNKKLAAGSPSFVKLPVKPKDANWAPPAKYIDKIRYKSDGAGFVKEGYTHIFIMSSDGGSARQLTVGDKDYTGPFSWSPDGKFFYFSANMNEESALETRDTELYQLEVETSEIKKLTDRKGPDNNPAISPDGKWIAYTGGDEDYKGYQRSSLYIMDISTQKSRCISCDFDRDIASIKWSVDSKSIIFMYDSEGITYIGRMDLNGKHTTLIDHVGGQSYGRPYPGGSYSLSNNGAIAYTLVGNDHPSDLAIWTAQNNKSRRLTTVNADLFKGKELGVIEEIWYPSSFDGKQVQGWICKPPGFDPAKKYPLILEIHGGPFANYGPRFAMEIQLFAAAGYVVLYTNPRGSTSYGTEFANYIHHNYPSEDYDDLISGVDALIAKGYIDEQNLFVTGGSGGGVLTAWIVGKTNRFKAAVVSKPVINWSSFVLHADGIAFFAKYWFGKYPWEDIESYWKRSPLSLVGNVSTPTMLLTGEQDYRTPMSETEQYYAALKLNGVETAMVRLQEASHGMDDKPSNLASKVAYILGWFDKYRLQQ